MFEVMTIDQFEFRSAKDVILEAMSTGIKPDPKITVNEWADQNRIMTTATSPETGIWRTDRTPYLREIMKALSPNSRTQVVTFAKASQVGATECVNNFIGAVIDKYPASMMYVVPSLDMAKKVSRTRLDPMINACPALKGKVKDQAAREAGNSMFLKEFVGGHLVLTTSNSASALRSHPIKYLCLDEVSAFTDDVDGEGDPVELAKARTVNFGRKRKIFQVSTPTIKGADRIELEFSRSSQEYYNIPCIHCGHKFVIEWEHIKWEKDSEGRHLPSTVYLECPMCKGHIQEHFKTWFMAEENGAEWIPTARGEPDHRGFHLSALYSPLGWHSWEEIVKTYLRAHERTKLADFTEMKSFYNTKLGLSWDDVENQVSDVVLFKEREDYPKGVEIPMNGVFLTLGADIQQDRIEASIYAFGMNDECWAVEHVVLWGNPTNPSDHTWEKLDELIFKKKWKHESGKLLGVSISAIDSGSWSDTIYQYVVSRKGKNVFPVKGWGQEDHPIIKPSKQTTFGRKRIPVRLWHVGTFELKRTIYIKLQALTDCKSIHYPKRDCFDESFFKQLTSEVLVQKHIDGHSKRRFHLPVGKRNEALDCIVYAFAAKRIYEPNIPAIMDTLGIKFKMDEVYVDEEVKEEVKVDEQPAFLKAVMEQRKNPFLQRPKKSSVTSW